MNKLELPAELVERMAAYSDFQKKVWTACYRIPKGSYATYQDLAKRIGRPGAARAVARALASNPFAPEIPCHRVVRTDGGLGGYSGDGGLQTKLRLLRKEGVAVEQLFPLEIKSKYPKD